MALSRRPSLALIFFLIANPVRGTSAQLFAGGQEGSYQWKNRGCIAVINSISGDAAKIIHLKDVLSPTDKQKLEAFAPDKVAAVAGLVISSCLLYHSIQLTQDIRLFYGKFKELRREFDDFVGNKLPKIQKLGEEIRKKIQRETVVDAKDQQHMMFVLMQFNEEVDHVLGRVRGLIKEAVRTQKKSNSLAVMSFAVSTAAAFALSPLVSIGDLALRFAVGATAGIGAAAGAWSLMNSHHCELALREMHEYEKKLEQLNTNVSRMQKHFEWEALYDWWSEFTFWVSFPDVF